MITIKKGNKLNSLTSGIVISLISLLFFLSFGELICRLIYKRQELTSNTIFEYDKDKIFRLKNNFKGDFAEISFETNSLGLRDEEIKIEKPEGEIRILVLGDSITFGHGVRKEEIFSEILEENLNEEIKGSRFRIINAGTPGNSTYQEYYDLKKLLNLNPNIVILQFSPNDVFDKYNFTRYGGVGVINWQDVEDMFFLHRFLLQKSYLYSFYTDLINNIRFGFTEREKIRKKAISNDWQIVENLINKPDDPIVKESWKDSLKWMQKIVDLCKKEKIDLLLLVSPYKFQIYLTEDSDYPQKILENFSEKNDIYFLDLLPVLREEIKEKIVDENNLEKSIFYEDLLVKYEDDITKEWFDYFLDNDHYSPNGHSYVAGLLYWKIDGILNERNY